jgi:hypothetical protein
MRDKKRPDELASRPRRRRAGNEVKKAVESEGKKDEAKKETGDDNGDVHIKFVCLIFIILTSILSVSS